MVTFTRFNIVLIGSFDGQSLDLNVFDFNGHALTAQLRVAPVLQAKAGEFYIESIPGRFAVGADSPKATEHRLQAIKAGALQFASEYAGRRSVTGVGLNFTGQSPVRGGAPALLDRLAVTDPLASELDAEGEPRISLTTTWDVRELGRLTVRLEPLDSDPTQLFFDVNVHIGEVPAGLQVPTTPLAVPLAEAVERFGPARDKVSSVIESVLAVVSDVN